MISGITLSLLLVACGPGDSSDSTVSGDSTGHEPLTEDDPPWDTEQVADQVHAALEYGWPRISDLRDSYLDMMSYGDEDCPGDDELMVSETTAMDGCTADSGWQYMGMAMYEAVGEMGDQEWIWSMTADFQITSPEGVTYGAGGGLMRTQYVGNYDTVNTILLLGTWLDEGAEDWLGKGISAEIDADLTLTDDGEVSQLVSGGMGIGDVDLYFDDLVYEPSCEYPSGAMSVYDTQGYWYRIDWSESCDSCGTLSYQGREIDTLCTDLAYFGDLLIEGMEE